MRIGKLKNYVRIESKSVTQGDFNEEVITWVEHLTGWADVQDITTRMQESTKSDLRLQKRPCKVTMRYNDTITIDMRVVVLDKGNRILQIVSAPAELGNAEAIEFMAEEYSV